MIRNNLRKKTNLLVSIYSQLNWGLGVEEEAIFEDLLKDMLRMEYLETKAQRHVRECQRRDRVQYLVHGESGAFIYGMGFVK